VGIWRVEVHNSHGAEQVGEGRSEGTFDAGEGARRDVGDERLEVGGKLVKARDGGLRIGTGQRHQNIGVLREMVDNAVSSIDDVLDAIGEVGRDTQRLETAEQLAGRATLEARELWSKAWCEPVAVNVTLGYVDEKHLLEQGRNEHHAPDSLQERRDSRVDRVKVCGAHNGEATATTGRRGNGSARHSDQRSSFDDVAGNAAYRAGGGSRLGAEFVADAHERAPEQVGAGVATGAVAASPQRVVGRVFGEQRVSG
jgi:hypothetical protein